MSAALKSMQTHAIHYRDIRTALNLTQSDFGSMLNAHAVTVSRWEHGHCKPDRYQQAVMASFQRAIDGDAPIRPDLDAVMHSCGPIYALYLVLHKAHGVQ